MDKEELPYQEFGLARDQAARRAERKAGEVLREMPKATGGQPYQATGCSMQPVEPTLSELGINKTESHRWQQIVFPRRVWVKHSNSSTLEELENYSRARVGETDLVAACNQVDELLPCACGKQC